MLITFGQGNSDNTKMKDSRTLFVLLEVIETVTVDMLPVRQIVEFMHSQRRHPQQNFEASYVPIEPRPFALKYLNRRGLACAASFSSSANYADNNAQL